jgi:hypothetical protein
VNKGVIFWIIWVAVVAVAGAFYFAAVKPKLDENQTKIEHRDLLAARLTELDKTGKIKTLAPKLATRDKFSPEDKKLFPENLVPTEDDQRIAYLYPLLKNRAEIPNERKAKYKKEEDEKLVAERKRFVGEFGGMQFALNAFLDGERKIKTARDFDPDPPADPDLFRQWVMGREGQDHKIDEAFEKAMGGKGTIKLCESRMGLPGGSCDWLEDGRCSGYIEEKKEVREQVLKRLVLRRVILNAVARAQAQVITLQDESYDEKTNKLVQQKKPETRRVQSVESLVFLDGDSRVNDSAKGFQAARNTRFSMGALPQLAREPVPYRPNGYNLRVKGHLAVVPALMRELERISEAESRPFACWVERVLIERPAGKPDWKADDPVPQEIPIDGGTRYHEWPVSVDLLVVVPEFDEKMDPLPEIK